jgi:isopenicillin-N epimerase
MLSAFVDSKALYIFELFEIIQMKDLFLLRDDIVFLNFGSFGATPKSIFEDYQKWQLLLEREPVQFITVDGFDYIKASINALAKYINCDKDELVFVSNPTYAINILAKNIDLQPGDEILTTDLEYGAMDKTWEYYSEKKGFKYQRQKITLPLTNKELFIHEFFKGYSDRTKAIFISQITSSTGLIFPVKEICDEAKKRGLITIVDGAHVPGHIELDLKELKADYYTGACHKWMMAPKGCSFLFARKQLHAQLDPLIISWGYKSSTPSDSIFFDHHQFNGTRDFSAFLTIPACLSFLNDHNWTEISKKCKQTVLDYAPIIAETLNCKPLAPLTNEFYGQMCSTPIQTDEPVRLQRLLFEKYQIEIPVMIHGNSVFIRFSMQGFNTTDELDYLVRSLHEIKGSTDLIKN